MGFSLNSIASSILRPITQSALREVSSTATQALHSVASGAVDSMIGTATSQVSNALRGIPLLGNPLADMVGQSGGQLNYIAQQYLTGGMDQLYSRMTGVPTSRPILGADGSYVLPSMADQYRMDQILSTLPNSSSYASTATGSSYYGSGGTTNMPVDGRTPVGGYPAYPQPPSDPTNLAEMKKYQDNMLKYNAAKDALQNDFGMRNAMQASHKNMMQQMIQNLGR